MEVAFYEIFRRHTSSDPRDRGLYTDYVIGTADTLSDAEDIGFDLNNLVEGLKEKNKGYSRTLEAVEHICPRTNKTFLAHRATNEWVDEFGFQEALEDYRKKYDPTFYLAENPIYMYKPVYRAPRYERNH